MKRILNKKRTIGFVLSMLISASVPNCVFAETELQLGDYIQLGSYNSNEIIWRYVGSDDNGKLMLSDSIVCYKAFDAAGEHTYSPVKSRSSYGSNLWSESNIRCWLNAETQQVDFTCGVVPSAENVWMGIYPYDSEPGFLNGFNDVEKSAIKTVALKTKLNDIDSDLSEGEYTATELDSEVNRSQISSKYQTTSDKIFLMDEDQLLMVKNNFKDDYYAKGSGVLGNVSFSISDSNMSDVYFLRSPNTYEKAADGVCNIGYVDGEVLFDKTTPAYMSVGIRPAFYITDNVSFVSGSGSEKDPFIVSNETHSTSPSEIKEKKLIVTNENNNIKVYADGNEIVFTDAKPFIDENDRTQIPIRAISEGLGFNVDYNAESQAVTVRGNDKNIQLNIGDNKLIINDSVTEMDTSAQIVNDRTYIPLRFVAQALGYTVSYSESVTGFSVNENGEITLTTEHGTFDEIKDLH